LRDAVSDDELSAVRAICTDAPDGLDTARLRHTFRKLECVIKDPLHLPLKVEQASGEKQTQMSKLLRRCTYKFNTGHDDGKAYYSHTTGRVSAAPRLTPVVSSMSKRCAEIRVQQISRTRYPETPYHDAAEFLKDVAAICKLFPSELHRYTSKKNPKTTVLASLNHATSAAAVEYMMNLPRFIGRNPLTTTSYGTTSNEAFHNQFKSFFRNVYFQTGRNLKFVCEVVAAIKVFGATLADTSLTSMPREHVLVRTVADIFSCTSDAWNPKVHCETIRNPRVDQSQLPRGAKVMRKRPRDE
jgi:hypothetical protein